MGNVELLDLEIPSEVGIFEQMSYTFGRNLRAARKELGLKQAAFAGLVGVSKNTVSLWETDEQVPRGTMLQRVAAVAKKTTEELTAGDPRFDPNYQEPKEPARDPSEEEVEELLTRYRSAGYTTRRRFLKAIFPDLVDDADSNSREFDQTNDREGSLDQGAA